MSDDSSAAEGSFADGVPLKPRQAKRTSQMAVLSIVAMVGVLALVAIVFVARDRLGRTVASDGQDMSASSLGLTAQGFSGNASAGSSTPVAQLAVNLMSRAFTFTPAAFDAQVAAAKKTMTVSVQKQYDENLAGQSLRSLVTGGISMKTTLVHFNADPKEPAYLGVISLTQTSGKFLMLLERSATSARSGKSLVTPLMLEVDVEKIGSTWFLSDLPNLIGS